MFRSCGVALIVLYSTAIFADFFSPFDRVGFVAEKVHHPPTRVYVSYEDRGRRVFRPFVYEMKSDGTTERGFRIASPSSLRVLSLGTASGGEQLRVVADQGDAFARRARIRDAVARYYGLPSNHRGLGDLEEALMDLQEAAASDLHVELLLGVRSEGGREIAMTVAVAKGNKNFLGLLVHGTPYRALGLLQTTIRLFGSPTGGVFLLGTDGLGRDVLSRLLHGGRVSLTVGLAGALLSLAIGAVIGGVTGYVGGRLDDVVMRFAAFTVSLPSFLVLLVLRAVLPSHLSSPEAYVFLVLALACFGSRSLAVAARDRVVSVKNEAYVLFARSIGRGHVSVVARHIVPQVSFSIVARAVVEVPAFMLAESALSVAGLGIREPQSSWGLMLSEAWNLQVVLGAPWILVPGIAILVSAAAWSFFGDRLMSQGRASW